MEVGNGMADVVQQREIDQIVVVFLVVKHKMQQFFENIVCNRHNLEVLGQESGD